MNRFSPINYLAIGIAVVGIIVAVGAPVLAYEWYSRPFLGFFLEPNLVVSGTLDTDLNIQNPDQLISVNGIPVENVSELNQLLINNFDETFDLEFLRDFGSGNFSITAIARNVSTYEMFTIFIIPYIVGTIFLIFGIWIFMISTGTVAARAFFVFATSISIALNAYLDLRTTHVFPAAWIASLPVLAGTAILVGMNFPGPSELVKKIPRLNLLPILLPLPFIVGSLSEYFSPTTAWAYIEYWRSNYILLGVSLFFFVGAVTLKVFLSSDTLAIRQSRIIVFGIFLSILPFLVLIILPAIFGWPVRFQVLFIFPPLLILPIVMGYSLARYRVLDVDLFLGRSLGFVITSGTALAFFYILSSMFSIIMQERLSVDEPILMATYLLFIVIALNPLRQKVQELINRVFYRNQQDFSSSVVRLSSELSLTPELDSTYSQLSTTIDQALGPTSFSMFIFSDEKNRYVLYNSKGAKGNLELDNPLVKNLIKSEKPLWIPEGARSSPESQKLRSEMSKWEKEVFVPIKTKDKLVGIIGLGPRRIGRPYNSRDLEYLKSVAGQSSLVFEISRLFRNLEKSNIELKEAYTTTLEGWSKALDLKDHETEGHSQRVTDITMKLARRVGIPNSKLRYTRWGALLHDIGKMGIPDKILLKPGPLSDNEWDIMKKHPLYSYELLKPIRFLKPAIDIPRSHHEKWDGSGYPDGIKENQIPLAARIFAIVDVWDALRSDRPYRKAWSKKKTLAHIRSQSGKHFDPDLLRVFIDEIDVLTN